MAGAMTALGGIAQQDMFMKLFLAQIQNQDPEEPMTNSEMVSQLAQLTTVDIMNKLNSSFADVLKLQTLLSGTSLVGRQVEYNQNGVLTQGKVESVDTTNGAVQLVVNGQTVTMDQVSRIF